MPQSYLYVFCHMLLLLAEDAPRTIACRDCVVPWLAAPIEVKTINLHISHHHALVLERTERDRPEGFGDLTIEVLHPTLCTDNQRQVGHVLLIEGVLEEDANAQLNNLNILLL